MLYYKNGVITEERFQKMTPIQWIFHYMEIVKMAQDEKRLFIERLDDISLGIQAFYLLVNREDGLKMIETISETKRKVRNDGSTKIKQKTTEQKTTEQKTTEQKADNSKASDELPDLLSDEEKELWAFMEQQPAVIKETKQMQHVGKYMLPKKSIKQLKEQEKTKIVDKISAEEIPKLGF